jgi:hypothetical protein
MNRKDGVFRDLERRGDVIQAVLFFILVMFLIQLWLITIALEDYLAGHYKLAWPTFMGSAACFLVNLWLLHYVRDVDRGREGLR